MAQEHKRAYARFLFYGCFNASMKEKESTHMFKADRIAPCGLGCSVCKAGKR